MSPRWCPSCALVVGPDVRVHKHVRLPKGQSPFRDGAAPETPLAYTESSTATVPWEVMESLTTNQDLVLRVAEEWMRGSRSLEPLRGVPWPVRGAFISYPSAVAAYADYLKEAIVPSVIEKLLSLAE